MDREEELDDLLDEDLFDDINVFHISIQEWDRKCRMAAHMICLVAVIVIKQSEHINLIDYSGIEDSMREVALAINKRNEILQKGVEVLLRSRACVYTEEEIFDELVRLGINSELLDCAYSFLIEKLGRMRVFFDIPYEKRVLYLKMMLNCAGDS